MLFVKNAWPTQNNTDEKFTILFNVRKWINMLLRKHLRNGKEEILDQLDVNLKNNPESEDNFSFAIDHVMMIMY